MMEQPPLSSRIILGTRVDGTSYADATERVLGWARAEESRSVYAANVHTVMEAYDHPAFRAMVNECDLVTPDGMPLVWSLRLQGIGFATRVYGPDLTPCVLRAAEKQEVSVGFYGGSKAVLKLLVERVSASFPALRIVYQEAPPFRPLTAEEDERVVAAIEASGARILFVGLGCPKQERWIAEHRGRIPAVMLGVGAAFDFVAGCKPQAPRWMQAAGLEWLFRFVTEPRRLWKRYTKHNPRFVWLMAGQVLRGAQRPNV
jgi:N-acetylglucosaminyldiphosphoundecaprenol N-acetyl-beta-D-mannosaminyltransferase